jgi:hypothetical protein
MVADYQMQGHGGQAASHDAHPSARTYRVSKAHGRRTSTTRAPPQPYAQRINPLPPLRSFEARSGPKQAAPRSLLAGALGSHPQPSRIRVKAVDSTQTVHAPAGDDVRARRPRTGRRSLSPGRSRSLRAVGAGGSLSSDASTYRPTTSTLGHGRTRKRLAVGGPLGAGDRFVADALASPLQGSATAFVDSDRPASSTRQPETENAQEARSRRGYAWGMAITSISLVLETAVPPGGRADAIVRIDALCGRVRMNSSREPLADRPYGCHAATCPLAGPHKYESGFGHWLSSMSRV